MSPGQPGRPGERSRPSRPLTPAPAPRDVVCVACEKRMLSVFSACGRRLLPPILLPSPISTLHCTGPYVMALTAAATLSVWDVHRQEVVVKEESLHSILAGVRGALGTGGGPAGRATSRLWAPLPSEAHGNLPRVSPGSNMTVSQVLLTQHGIPVMNLSDGKAYCFSPSLSAW